VVLSIAFSFTTFNMLKWPDFIFMDNYIRLFLDDDIFITALKNTLIFAVLTGPVSYILALFIAWFINELSPKIRSLVTLVFYAPSISGQVYLVWKILFSSDAYGLVNAKMIDMGLIYEPILWFDNEKYTLPLCVAVALWTSLGTSFLVFIAGLQGINRSHYEAAAVDGIRNRWQELWYITLPEMGPQLMFGSVLQITKAFGFGGIVTDLCGLPSVNYSAHTIMNHLQDYGGQRFEVGYSSTIAVILFIMMVGSNILIKKMLSKVGK
ncbi:MAG: sugar ABC transporter permease, partial [Clostridia bacterium]|nr:sugar ABC transporter permease [Clostridia bacterium]